LEKSEKDFKSVEEEPFKGKDPESCPKCPRADRKRSRAVSREIGDNFECE